MKRSELWGCQIKDASQHAITTCLSLKKEDLKKKKKRNSRKKAEPEHWSHHPGTQKDTEEEKVR